jgi:hypothetical protein
MPRFVQLGGKGEVSLHEVYIDWMCIPYTRGGRRPALLGLRPSRGDEGERIPLLEHSVAQKPQG